MSETIHDYLSSLVRDGHIPWRETDLALVQELYLVYRKASSEGMENFLEASRLEGELRTLREVVARCLGAATEQDRIILEQCR